MQTMERLRGFTNSEQVRQSIRETDKMDISLFNASNRLDQIVYYLTGEQFGDWNTVQGLTILDLGCGSEYSSNWVRKMMGIHDAPNLCRLLSARGANAFGIDLDPASEKDKEVYTHIQADLLDYILQEGLQTMPQLQEIKFDIIHSHELVGEFPSPTLEDGLERRGLHIREFRRLLVEQSALMMKVLLLDDITLKKINGQLVPTK